MKTNGSAESLLKLRALTSKLSCGVSLLFLAGSVPLGSIPEGSHLPNINSRSRYHQGLIGIDGMGNPRGKAEVKTFAFTTCGTLGTT